MDKIHVGRSWTGNKLEEDCPCPKAACGLVLSEHMVDETEKCSQHSGMKTFRQIHTEENCPALKK